VTTSGDNRAPWTTLEIKQLRDSAHLGIRECAKLLGRSPGSVRQAAARNRISLRRQGSRAGLLMGQPRGHSLWSLGAREDLVRGRRDELVAERLRLDAAAQLCPACGRRPIRVQASGYCSVCHTERLRELHEELTDDDAALRGFWAARSRRRAKLDELDAKQKAKTAGERRPNTRRR